MVNQLGGFGSKQTKHLPMPTVPSGPKFNPSLRNGNKFNPTLGGGSRFNPTVQSLAKNRLKRGLTSG